MNNRLNPSDLVVAVLTFSPIINESVEAARLSEEYLKSRICAKYNSPVLKYAGINHGSKEEGIKQLSMAVDNLVNRQILHREFSLDCLDWIFADSPRKYFEQNISSLLSPYRMKQLIKFSEGIN